MNPKKLSNDTVKIIAGAILATGFILGTIFTFLAVVDLSLARKILIGFILFLAWIILNFVERKRGKIKNKQKTNLALLLDLIISVRNEVNPESKKIFREELFVRIVKLALIGLILVIILAGLFNWIETVAEKPIDRYLHPSTQTSTPTQTLTLTSSPTLIPEADTLYYLFVLDASDRMKKILTEAKRNGNPFKNPRLIILYMGCRNEQITG